MKTVKMTFENPDGKIVVKDIEERLVSVYKSMGWKLQQEKPKREEIKPIQERNTFSRRNVNIEE